MDTFIECHAGHKITYKRIQFGYWMFEIDGLSPPTYPRSFKPSLAKARNEARSLVDKDLLKRLSNK